MTIGIGIKILLKEFSYDLIKFRNNLYLAPIKSRSGPDAPAFLE